MMNFPSYWFWGDREKLDLFSGFRWWTWNVTVRQFLWQKWEFTTFVKNYSNCSHQWASEKVLSIYSVETFLFSTCRIHRVSWPDLFPVMFCSIFYFCFYARVKVLKWIFILKTNLIYPGLELGGQTGIEKKIGTYTCVHTYL